MDFSLPADLTSIRETVRAFVEANVEARARQIEEEDRIPEDLISEAGELGLFGLGIPRQYCGIGLGMLGRCLVYEELGKSHQGFGTFIGTHTGIGTVGLLEVGGEFQKRKYLPAMARGELIAAFALTEPEAGSDVSIIKTRAIRRGDRWILNGTKHFITNGPIADILTVIAVTDPARGARGGFSAFLVEKGFPGFSVGSVEHMGPRGSHTADIILEDCEVPEENLLGEEGAGYSAALRILANARTGLAAQCVGTCERLLELSVAHSKQRVQFGRPIGDHQAIRFMLAEMATATAAARALTYQVAWMMDQGMRSEKEPAMAKLMATEALGRVADMAVQIHGGQSYSRDCPVARFYRDARITRLWEGTSEIQRLIIASRLLKEYAS